MSEFWEEQLSPGYYDKITIEGINKNRGISATWHNYTNLKVKSNISKSGKHLDYACGPGTLIGMYLNSDSIGIDISQKQIEFANKKYSNKGEFFEINNFDLTRYNGEFKTITILGLLEFINEDEIIALLDRLYLLLEPRGQIILTTPNFQISTTLLIAIKNLFGDYTYQESHISKFSRKKLLKVLEKTKFNNYEVTKYMNFAVSIGVINLKLATKAQEILDKLFSRYFGYMLFIKLKK